MHLSTLPNVLDSASNPRYRPALPILEPLSLALNTITDLPPNVTRVTIKEGDGAFLALAIHWGSDRWRTRMGLLRLRLWKSG